MEFLKGVCPHCKGELQIPQDRETIICMYCGKELAVKDALSQQEEVSRPKPVTDEAAIEALQRLLYGIDNPMQYFKKALYMEFFNKYVFENAKNSNLKSAYAEYENKILKEKIKQMEQNQNNASNSVVSPTSNGSSTEQQSKDAFLDGFDSI